ncbi:phenylacetate--CoA ligase family protein, partial [Rhodovulum sulfidophilum]|nr:phenylacetate--CoA ligase family protein [Rhodovulum sulfidophilum]
MSVHFDDLETRSEDERAASLAECLPALVAEARALPGYAGALAEVNPL